MASPSDPEDDTGEPTARVVGTVASHLEDRIARSERHLRDLINNMDRRVEQRFDDMEKAVEKAEKAAEKRFDSVNEFRAQLNDQAATFVPRAEADAKFTGLSEKVDRVIAWQERNEGQDTGTAKTKAGSVVTTNMVIAIVGVGLALLIYVAPFVR